MIQVDQTVCFINRNYGFIEKISGKCVRNFVRVIPSDDQVMNSIGEGHGSSKVQDHI